MSAWQEGKHVGRGAFFACYNMRMDSRPSNVADTGSILLTAQANMLSPKQSAHGNLVLFKDGSLAYRTPNGTEKWRKKHDEVLNVEYDSHTPGTLQFTSQNEQATFTLIDSDAKPVEADISAEQAVGTAVDIAQSFDLASTAAGITGYTVEDMKIPKADPVVSLAVMTQWLTTLQQNGFRVNTTAPKIVNYHFGLIIVGTIAGIILLCVLVVVIVAVTAGT